LVEIDEQALVQEKSISPVPEMKLIWLYWFVKRNDELWFVLMLYIVTLSKFENGEKIKIVGLG
jgi:hypothetical protein